MDNSLNSNLETLFSKMERFITTKTVVGDPIHIEDVILVPLVDISFGVGAAVSDGKHENKGLEAGGGGLGGKITPTAVLVIVNGTVQLVNVKNQDSVNKLIDLVPGIISKLNLGSFFTKKKNTEKNNSKIVFEETKVSTESDDDEPEETFE